jgi:hypothetical protein
MTIKDVPDYRITLEALGEDGEPVARYSTRGMKFTADAVEIGGAIFATILRHEGLEYYGICLEPQVD